MMLLLVNHNNYYACVIGLLLLLAFSPPPPVGAAAVVGGDKRALLLADDFDATITTTTTTATATGATGATTTKVIAAAAASPPPTAAAAAAVVVVVSSTEEATQLRNNLIRSSSGSSPGAVYEVEWQGTIRMNQPLQVTNGTSLKIKGSGRLAGIDGGGLASLFVVNASALRLEGLSLTGGRGEVGGVVAARDKSSLTFVECEVGQNTASLAGGAVFLEDSSLVVTGTSFSANSADVLGGAVYASKNSTVLARDCGKVFDGNSARNGGALYLDGDSKITFSGGETAVSGNYALFQGGAIYAENSCTVKIGGTTGFTDNNSGFNGGVIFARRASTVTTAGNTSFVENSSSTHGGAVMLTDRSRIRTSGNTTFTRNTADGDGGAIQAEVNSRVHFAGNTLFKFNFAGGSGGGVNGFDEVKVRSAGWTSFIANKAEYGGAANVHTSATLSLGGSLTFDNNTASNDGGALHVVSSRVKISGHPHFVSNSARGGSGGAIYCGSVTRLSVKNAVFMRNTAVWGGAVAAFSSGAQAASSSSSLELSTSEELRESYGPSLTLSTTSTSDSAEVLSPAKFKNCRFERNRASEDGGAMYSVAGFDVFRKCDFARNQADSSGGAFVHAGVIEQMSDTTFRRNRAGKEGPAILSLGLLNSISDVTFDSNAFYCAVGKFSGETPADENECRFAKVCSRCASKCGSDLEASVTVMNPASVPLCKDPPEGADSYTRGTTLQTLELHPGFFRPSLDSTDIRECFHEEACQGGAEMSEYCAPGYGGPYCAVCVHGYAPGYSHTCKSCFGHRRQQAVGVMAAIVGLLLVAVGLGVAKLVSVVDTAPNTERRAETQGEWEKRWGVWRDRLRKKFPLTAVKIVVVVWQIVTQFSDVAGVKYPGAYRQFLATIDVVNLDLGFILSFACIYRTDFYDRLLMATLGPAVVLAVLGCTYLVALGRNRTSPESVAAVKTRHLSVALLALFLVYATVSHTIFETFVCDTLDGGETYLRADYSLLCNTPLHTGFQVYAGLMVIVYPLGIPCVLGWWLYVNRDDLKRGEDRQSNPRLRPAADLWEPYTRERYYYEVVECFRRIALTGLAVFVYPDSSAQIAIVLLLATMFMVVSEILSPFSCPVEMWLYRTGHYVVFASMFLALLLRVDISDERERSQEVFSGVIVVAHAAMILVVVGQGLLIFVGWERPEEHGREVVVAKVLADCPITDNNNGGGNEEDGEDHNMNPLYGGKETPTTTTTNTTALRGVGGQGSLAAPKSPAREQWENSGKSLERPTEQWEDRDKSLERPMPTAATMKTFLVSDLSRPSSSTLALSAFKTAPPTHSTRQFHDGAGNRSRRGQSLTRNQRYSAGITTPLATAPEEAEVIREEDPPKPTSVVTKSRDDDGARVHKTLTTEGGGGGGGGLAVERAKALTLATGGGGLAVVPAKALTLDTGGGGGGGGLVGERGKALSSPQSSWLSSAPPGERPRSSPVFSGRELFGGRSSARWGWTTSMLSAEEKSEISEFSKCSDDLAVGGRLWSPRGRFFHPTTTTTTERPVVAVERVCVSPPDHPRPPRGGSDAAPTPDAKVGRRSSRPSRRSLISGGAKEEETVVVSAHPSSSSRRMFFSNPEPGTSCTTTTHATTRTTAYDLACGGIIVSPAETPRTDMGQETPRSLTRSAPRTEHSSGGCLPPHEAARTPRATGRPRQGFFRSPADRARSPVRERKMWAPGSFPIDEDIASVNAGWKNRSTDKKISNSFKPSSSAREVAPRSGQQDGHEEERRLRNDMLSSGSSCGSLVIEGAEARMEPRSGQQIEGHDEERRLRKDMLSSGSSCGSLVIEEAELHQQGCTQEAGNAHGSSSGGATDTGGMVSNSRSGGIYTGRRSARSTGYRPTQGVPSEAQGEEGEAKSDNKAEVVTAKAAGGRQERAGWHPIFRSPTY